MKIFILLGLMVCAASAQSPVYCGTAPPTLFKCMGSPQVVNPDVAAKCTSVSECERMKCIFKKSGWMNGDNIDRQKAISYFDTYAKDHPAWGTAVTVTKRDCLSGDLPSQGVYLGCPAYDIIHCALNSFIKNVQPSQWSTSPSCEQPRRYAESCPLCPEDCFGVAIPTGSCNACRLLPRAA